MVANKHWSGIKERAAGFFRLQLMLWIYRILGRFWVQILLYPVVFFTVISSAKLRQASKQYLNQIYLKKGKSNFPKPGFWKIFKHVLAFAVSLLDRVESWSGNIKVNNLNIKTPQIFEEIKALLEEKKGVFLIGSHLGNMEMFRGLSIVSADLKINAVIQTNYTKHFTNLLKKVNKNSGINVIPATEIGVDQAIILDDKLQDGEIVVIKGDRTAAKNQDKNLALNFLGKKAKFPLGPFLMAKIMKHPTYFVFCLKNEKLKKSYDIYFFKVDLKLEKSRQEQKGNIEIVMQEYVAHLEKLCLQYPWQWFNFFEFWQDKK